jgi:hypothetical protein
MQTVGVGIPNFLFFSTLHVRGKLAAGSSTYTCSDSRKRVPDFTTFRKSLANSCNSAAALAGPRSKVTRPEVTPVVGADELVVIFPTSLFLGKFAGKSVENHLPEEVRGEIASRAGLYFARMQISDERGKQILAFISSHPAACKNTVARAGTGKLAPTETKDAFASRLFRAKSSTGIPPGRITEQSDFRHDVESL